MAYVDQKIENGRLSSAQRAHLLYVVLVGNLDIGDSAEHESIENTAWNDIDGPHGLLNHLRDVKLSPKGKAKAADEAVKKTETQLRTMLAAQYSFGVTVGAPVAFFCGQFIFALLQNLSNLGDNNVSHALGMLEALLAVVIY